jgi:hypothetical protein
VLCWEQDGILQAKRAKTPSRHSLFPSWLIHLGIPGLFAVAIIDSSPVPLPIPGSTDLLLPLLILHGGPTRARAAWASLGVDGLGIANDAPGAEFLGLPKLTVRMVARLQGFPDSWQFSGGKTAAYRQVGNAFPPPVARAVACSIRNCLTRPRLARVAG